MAELTFFHGTMNCGKSTMALQIHHNAVAAGKRCVLLTRNDRAGGVISSRIGLTQPALVIDDTTDLYAELAGRIEAGARVDIVICDEAQFTTPAQVEQLADIVDVLGVEVQAFGLLTDFTTRMFPGSRRLVELADRCQQLPVDALCWCGRRGTHNARTVGGQMVTTGEQVVVGDVDGDTLAYEVLCRRHHREGRTRSLAPAEPRVRLAG